MTTRTDKTRLRSARTRSLSSQRWLTRQLNDPLVQEARRRGFRARSVFKLEELDLKHGLLRPGRRVVDLGAAPGSWSQYAAQKGCQVLAIDLLPVDPIPGVDVVQGDFLDAAVQDELIRRLDCPVEIVLSDIAADATGQRTIDRLRAEAVGEAVFAFAEAVLAPGGAMIVKLLKGAEAKLVAAAKLRFASHRLVKPAATRSESSEIYLVGLGRKPRGTITDAPLAGAG